MTWTVDDDESADFNTIQEAIDNATSGDTIFVHTGTYHEHVVINKSVSLIGEDRESTIIDGDNTGNVISIIRANNVSIEGFTVIRSGMHPYSGVSIDHSSGIDVSHNTITNNNNGISLDSSSSNMFSDNTISSNNNNGINLYFSSSNMFSDNTIFSNNNDGISLYLSSSNRFSGNNIFSNNYYGMYLVLDSKNNIIYCNNFDNVHQVLSDPTNVWDYEDKGNYWNDYTGQDLDADGIGDFPYVIDVNNRDNYPLMGMFFDFKVTWKRATYHTTIICNSTISNFRFEIGPETGNKIIRFNVTGDDNTVGFCRIMISTELMNYPYIVLVDMEEIVPSLLEHVSSETRLHLYFMYIYGNHAIRIISSRARRLEMDLHNLNVTYHALRNDYNILLGNYSELQKDHQELNDSYQEHLNNYSILLGNHKELQTSYGELNDSYKEQVHNLRNLLYMFATTTAIFLITTIYLSKRVYGVTAFWAKTHGQSESKD